MKSFFKKVLFFINKAKSADCGIKSITTEWRGKRIEFDVKNKMLFYKNVLLPQNMGIFYPNDFCDVYSTKLNDTDFEVCINQTKKCLDKIPFERECPFLGLPGASHDAYMKCVDVQDNCLYYTNTYAENFQIKKEPVHDEFVKLFELFSSRCNLSIISSKNVRNNKPISDPRYLEETLWTCKICGMGNLFEDHCCVKCGENRGW